MLPGSLPKEFTSVGSSGSSNEGGTGAASYAANTTNASTTQSAAASGSTRYASKKVHGTTTAAAAMGTYSRYSPSSLKSSGGTSSPLGGSSSGSSSTGCVRWCMNVALQSFTGEPWAVTLQPAAEDEFVLNRSFSGSTADSSALFSTHTAAMTTTAAANGARQRPLPGVGTENSNTSGSGSVRSSPVHGPCAARMSPSMLRSGLQLAVIDYSEPQVQYPGGAVLDASMFGYDPQSEDAAALHQCVLAVNSPPVTYGVDDLLGRITNVEFIAKQNSPEETAAGSPMPYRLASSLEPMLNATLNPAVAAVIDHCVSSMVLVYGATQEMKQMGLIGTPEECGLLPHGIRTMMDRFLERKEQQQSKSSSVNGSPKPLGDKPGGGQQSLTSPPLKPSGSPSSPQGGGDDVVSDGDHTEGGHSRSATSHAYSFVFPSIGSRHHRFVRVEATFIAFDSTSLVDLLDLSNKRVELVLKLAPPPTPSTFEEKADDVNASSSSSATTDSFVLNARAMPVENTNDALSILDVGLENLSRALELSLLPSESGSSLLFSLTAFTDTCRCATMHVLCLAEDPAVQTWLASTVQARSQAIPLGEEQSWASIQNTPMPPPLHHHAATMLVPALCFGNMFTSILTCVYNSITALSRLNRDLTFAVTGYRMRTIPHVTLASSRRGLKKLPPSWKEYFTNDGRRYFIDTTTQTTTWEDPRLTHQPRPSRPGSALGGNTEGNNGASAGRGGSPQHRPSRIGLCGDDKDFLANRLQPELHNGSGGAMGGAPHPANTKESLKAQSANTNAAPSDEESIDIGIVVVDTMCRPRVLIGSSSPRFAQQYVEQEKILRDKQHELEVSMEAMRKEAEEKRTDAAAAAGLHTISAMPSSSGGAETTHPDVVPVTATSSVRVETIADPTAPMRPSDLNVLLPSPVSGRIGLDDVEDEEVSSLCRSTSGNIDDFIFDDNSDEDTKKERGAHPHSSAGTSAGPTPSACTGFGGGSGGGHTRAGNDSAVDGNNAEAQFYANVLQEHTMGVVEMTSAATSSAGSAVASAPFIETTNVSSRGGAGSQGQGAGVATESDVQSNVVAAVPPEVQDLESLVDEFTAFYRKTYSMQKRIVELEAELRKHKEASRGANAFMLPLSVAAGEARWTYDVVQEMRKAVAASPFAAVQKAVLPLLMEVNAEDANSSDGGRVIVAAFKEALRLAAPSSRSAEDH